MVGTVSGLTMSLILIVGFSFLIGCALTGILARAQGRLRVLDFPGERSLHAVPVPRTGGGAILVGTLAGVVALSQSGSVVQWSAWAWGALLALVLVSFLDDLYDLPALPRLVIHTLAGGMLVLGGLGVAALRLPGYEMAIGATASAATSILAVVWMTNLYNFMDGMDGLAGGMAVFGFGTLGLLGAVAGDMNYAALCWVIAAAAAGFLVWNFPPARIFMGDTGSSVLGLLAAALSLYGDAADLFPLWIAVLVFSPFIVDATVTLVRRSLQGQRIWKPHRDHYYQRLVQTGWGHRRTMLWAYALMAVCCAAAMLAHLSPVAVQWLIIAAVAVLHVLAIAGVRRLESRSAPLGPVSRSGGGTG